MSTKVEGQSVSPNDAKPMLYAVFWGRKNISQIYFEKVCEIKIKYYLCKRLVIQII